MKYLLDCTFRDGGYYNAWDFAPDLIDIYLESMRAAQVDVVELGFRFLSNRGFMGPCAFTTDEFLRNLNIPERLSVSVMVNGGDLLTDVGLEPALERLFPETAASSPVDIVRVACHFHEFERVLPAVRWLSSRGYKVVLNLMQISDRSREEVVELAWKARGWPVEVLYFADSMGGMTPDDTAQIVGWLREQWHGAIGVHTHDNMGLALANTLRAEAEGATWLDATVTGMGRGPGNARTEELVIEAEGLRGNRANIVPLMAIIDQHFKPMRQKYGWGRNAFYYLSGKYGIHPTYIQEMLTDARYDAEDILAVIDHLREIGGKKFSAGTLESARNFYTGSPRGSWSPSSMLEDREVVILGTGPSAARHRAALEAYIRKAGPIVVALNTQTAIDPSLIDLRAACHPVRMLADAETHVDLPQPLIAPASMLPARLQEELSTKTLLDFGLGVSGSHFDIHERYCIAPNSLVLGYSLAVATSGRAKRILMAGFDGYPAGDTRNDEIEAMLQALEEAGAAAPRISVTPTRYKNLISQSIYGF